MHDFSKIIEQLNRREQELQERREQLKDLVLDINEAEREKIIKKAGNDPFYFGRKVFPEYCSKPFNRMHKDIKNIYERQKRGVDVVAGPPEHGKTAWLRVLKIWGAVYGKRQYQIKVTETMDLSTIDLASIKLEFEENPRIRFLYGDLKTHGKWESEAFKVAPTKFNKSGCWFEAFAFGVPPTGRLRGSHRPDFCDIDDLENYKKSGNIDISKEKLEFINNDVIPRMSMNAPIIWFGNNARKTMAINIIIGMDPLLRQRDFPAFKIHLYPAFDVKKKEALWKEVYKFKDEEEMRLHFGVGLMTWNGNYQQKPMVPDGTEFKKMHWREYKSLPKDAMGVIMCDPASGKSGCYKAAAALLFSRSTMKFHIEQLFCRQCDWEEYFIWMYDAYLSLQKHVRFIGWEEDFHQDQFLLFRRLYPSVKDRPELPIKPIRVKNKEEKKNKDKLMKSSLIQSGGPKDERIRTLAVPYEMGQITFNHNILLSNEGLEAQSQLIGFPDYQYNDFPDALASAYRIVFNMFAGLIPMTGRDLHPYESIETLRTSRDMF